MKHFCVRTFLMAGAVLCVGCGSGEDPAGRVAVSGAVTLDGNPVSSGRVTFIPQDDSDSPGAAATLDEAGRFSIPSSAGPTPGTYKVKFTLHPTQAGSKFDPRMPMDNQTFHEETTIADGSAAELSFALTSASARAARDR